MLTISKKTTTELHSTINYSLPFKIIAVGKNNNLCLFYSTNYLILRRKTKLTAILKDP